MEEYKRIMGYSDYSISNLGNVISHKRGKKIQIKLSSHKGYIRFGVCQYGKSETLKVHREVYKAFASEDIAGFEINHIDCDKSNNMIENLEKVTHAENMNHAKINNLLQKGSVKYSAKLKESDIPVIKNLFHNEKISQRNIAKQYFVSHTTIKEIINGTKWV